MLTGRFVRKYGVKKRGLSLAEVLLAIGLLAVGILTLSGLSLSALKAGQKSSQVMEAGQVAVMKLEEIRAGVETDNAFWTADHISAPYRQGTVRIGKTEYEYRVYSQTLLDQTTGAELGSAVPDNHLKKLDIEVSWFGDSSRDGYGRRSMRESCLVNQ